MIPIKDDNPTLHTPWVTYLLVGVNSLVFLFSVFSLEDVVRELGTIPWEVWTGKKAPQSELLPGIPSLFTSMFMHGGWFHLIGNMWFLWIFGNNVEDSMGSLRFLIFYLLCGLFAHGGQFLYIRLTAGPPPSIPLPPSLLLELGSPSVQWFIPMVGASGAISGVMAAYGRLFPHARVHTILPVLFYITVVSVPAGLMIGYWFLLQVLQGVLAPPVGGGIAFFAHIGGFVAGWFLYYPFLRPQIRERIAFQKRWRKYLQESLF